MQQTVPFAHIMIIKLFAGVYGMGNDIDDMIFGDDETSSSDRLKNRSVKSCCFTLR